MLAIQINKQESEQYINKFNENIFEKQVSNVIFKDDSFIKFVTDNVCIVNLNPIIPIRTFILVIGIICAILEAFFINLLSGVLVLGGTIILFLTWETMYYILFKKGLKKAGYTGKIKLL